MREIDPDVWINYVLNRTKNEQYLIVDDVRYKNEIKALKNKGVLDDLIIIVSSDHGENHGELGMWAEHGTADHISRKYQKTQGRGCQKQPNHTLS